MRKLFICILFLFSVPSFGQYDTSVITLEIHRWFKEPKYTRIELTCESDSSAIVEVRYQPFLDTFVFERPEADERYEISRDRYNEIIEMISNISVGELIKGMSPYNPSLRNEPTGFRLTLRVLQESIIFDINEPGAFAEERKLEVYRTICKEMLLLAKLKPKRYGITR